MNTNQGLKRGPDFLCIGLQKGGTRWVYDAMLELPSTMMPPIKEINHFALLNGRKGNDFVVEKIFRQQLRDLDRDYATVDEDLRKQFRSAVESYIKEQTHKNYRQLFCMSEDKITGDVSPAYSLLSPREVARVFKVLPNVRIVLSVRHPVARAWSHFNMHLRMTMAKEGLSAAQMHNEIHDRSNPLSFKEFIEKSRTTRLSSPSVVYDRWSKHFKDLIIINFSDIVERPASVVSKLSRELMGVTLQESDAPNVPNKKETSAKAKIGADHTEIGLNHFKDEIARCRERFEFAKTWEG